MENYYFVNIFETKGLETLLTIGYVLVLLFFIKYFFGSKKKGAKDQD